MADWCHAAVSVFLGLFNRPGENSEQCNENCRYPFDFQSTFEVADIRMYPGAAIPPESVYQLAMAPTPDLSPSAKCHNITSVEMQEQTWKDLYDHGCDWYKPPP